MNVGVTASKGNRSLVGHEEKFVGGYFTRQQVIR